MAKSCMTHRYKPDAAPKEEWQACPSCNATRKVIGTVVQKCECGAEAFDMADMPYAMSTEENLARALGERDSALARLSRVRAAILPLLTEIKEMRDGLPQDCAADLQVIAGWDAVIGPVEQALRT